MPMVLSMKLEKLDTSLEELERIIKRLEKVAAVYREAWGISLLLKCMALMNVIILSMEIMLWPLQIEEQKKLS